MTTVTDVDLLRTLKHGNKSSLTPTFKRNKLPVLTGVCIRQSGDVLEVVSTDLETVSRDSCRAENGNWGIVIPASRGSRTMSGGYANTWRWANPLIEWLKALEPSKRQPVLLELECVPPPVFPVGVRGDSRSYLQVTAGNIKARFYGFPADEFPNVSDTLSRFETTVIREPIVIVPMSHSITG